MRLVDGLTQYEGRVEIHWNSEWRTVSSDGWDEQDAVVVCRQLNYLATSVHIQGIKLNRTLILYLISSCMFERLYHKIMSHNCTIQTSSQNVLHIYIL